MTDMRFTRKKILAAGAVCALVAPLVLQVSGAGAASPPRLAIAKTLSSGVFVGPLQFAVSGSNVYVGDSFQSALFKIGDSTPIARGGPNPKTDDLSGVAVNKDNGNVAYTSTENGVGYFTILHGNTPIRRVNLTAFENAHNPDGRITYGLKDPKANACAAASLRKHHLPVTYTGKPFSHPYATAYLGRGQWAVADAGANDILRVTAAGAVSVMTVPPRQDFVPSAAFVKASKLAACVVGVTYYTETVPTDVEAGPQNSVYFSTLPGGPDGMGVPPRGGIWRLYRPIGSQAKFLDQIGAGFHDVTNIAVTKGGGVYAAQPFVGTIAADVGGKPSYRMSLPGVVSLEVANGHLYAATAPALIGSKDPSRVVQLHYR